MKVNLTEVVRETRAKLKTSHITLLIALDGTRNIHKAAEQTSMSQPAASKMLKDIEDAYDVPLFVRQPRGVEPTPYGEAVLRASRLAMASLRQADESVAALKSGYEGQVNLGVIITPCTTLIPQAIARSKLEAPRLNIGVEVSTSNHLVRRLKRGYLDIVVGRIHEQEDTPHLQYEELSRETECVIARTGHPYMRRKDLTLKDLSTAGWVISARGSILRNRFDMMFRRAGLDVPSNVVDTTSDLVILNLVLQTDTLHVVPIDIASFYVSLAGIRILPIPIPCAMESYGLVLHGDHVPSPGARLVLKHIREVAAEAASARD